MVRQTIIFTDLVLSVIAIAMHVENLKAKDIQTVATFQQQPTGVAVSSTDRLFVNFPNWSDDHTVSVVEVLSDGTQQPYPNERWNSWSKDGADANPNDTFVCVQSVWVDDRDRLWVLDPASPKMQGVVKGGPKLVCINLATSQVEKVYRFDENIAPEQSYLNDVRIDTRRNYAYITESGMGAIIVVNLQTGEARRLLDDHRSTKAESEVNITINGKPLREDGKTPQIHADGIALSMDGEHLYYHALTGKKLYRVATRLLRDDSVSTDELAQGVEEVGKTLVTDGLAIDTQGSVYHTALEQNAIVRFTPDQKLETVVKDDRIQWPDSLAWARNTADSGELYFTTSQIHHMPRFNDGQSTRTEPYRLFKVVVPKSVERVTAAP